MPSVLILHCSWLLLLPGLTPCLIFGSKTGVSFATPSVWDPHLLRPPRSYDCHGSLLLLDPSQNQRHHAKMWKQYKSSQFLSKFIASICHAPGYMVSKIHIYPTNEHFLNNSMERGLNTLFNSRNTSLFSHYSGYLFFLDSLSVSIFIVPGKCTTISFMSLSRHHDSHIILVKSLQFSLALPFFLLHAIVVLLSVLICTEMLLKS